jgi:hypothetical protein
MCRLGRTSQGHSTFQPNDEGELAPLQGELMNFRFTDESLNWRQLCRAAVLEQDPDKLFQIVQRINFALKVRQRVLRNSAQARRDNSPHTSSRSNRAA